MIPFELVPALREISTPFLLLHLPGGCWSGCGSGSGGGGGGGGGVGLGCGGAGHSSWTGACRKDNTFKDLQKIKNIPILYNVNVHTTQYDLSF